jgi:glycosyltransferase involved in cell wall biosynthesis
MNPLVSIIIPVFNQREEFLRASIESALLQTYDNLEIVISDNHSTNGASNVISTYQDARVIKTRPVEFLNMNDSFAFAASCANANSKYISFLSSDDILSPCAISELVNFAESNPTANFITGNTINSIAPPDDFESSVYKVRNSSHKVGLYTQEDSIGLFCPWKIASVWMVGDLIQHRAYKDTGGFFNCDYYISGDLWLTAELLKQRNFQFGCIEVTTGFFRQRPKGVLPADGVRGFSIHLDMLRYCNEMFRFAAEGNVRFKYKMLILKYKLATLLKAIIHIIYSRKYSIEHAEEHLNRYRDYIKNNDIKFENWLLSAALNMRGLTLDFLALFSRILIDVKK